MAYRFQPNVAINERASSHHREFNRLFKNSLIEDQKLRYIPNQDEIHTRAAHLIVESKKTINDRSPIKLSSYENARHIDKALEFSQWMPISTSDGRVKIISIIDELALTEECIEWVQEIFQVTRDTELHQMTLCLADVPSTGTSSSSYIDMTAKIGIRKARHQFMLWAKNNKDSFSGFRYPLLQRIDDWVSLKFG